MAIYVNLSERMQKLPTYPFVALRNSIVRAIDKGVDVINLGIGDPDEPTPSNIVSVAQNALDNHEDLNRHRYGCDVPVPELQSAFREFYLRQWDVKLSDDQVQATTGSKDAIVQLCLGILNPGDFALTPYPCYPTYNIGHIIAGAHTVPVKIGAHNDFLVDFDHLGPSLCDETRILWLNYPNNPTTATAPLEFFERAVEFGLDNDILIAHDAAYSLNTYDGYEAPSILQVKGAEGAAVEFFSLSKAFNMTGWRVGCMVGNAEAIRALRLVQNNTQNGTLRAVQYAAVEALLNADKLLPGINATYERRRNMVVEALNRAGWQLERPKATVYVWAPIPQGYDSSENFAKDLLDKTGIVVTPGTGFGDFDDKSFRISLTASDQRIAQACDRIVETKFW